MTNYSVKQLSKLANVSVRTLHHYDHIGLLKPAERTGKGYRFYTRDELFKLQQILFYKELDLPLKEIREIVNNPSFKILDALVFHKDQLLQRSERLKTLIDTVNKTISELKNQRDTMNDKDIYKGFDPKEMNAIKKEVTDRWGEEELKASEERIKKLGADGWEDTKKKGEEVNQLLADLMVLDPSHIQVQKAIALHHKHLNIFYEVTKERYLGLGKMYTEDERFKSHYDQYNKGLASFIYEAIKVYCDNGMKVIN